MADRCEGRGSTLFAQFGTTLMGHPSFNAPQGVGGGLCHHCTEAEHLLLLTPAFQVSSRVVLKSLSVNSLKVILQLRVYAGKQMQAGE